MDKIYKYHMFIAAVFVVAKIDHLKFGFCPSVNIYFIFAYLDS